MKQSSTLFDFIFAMPQWIGIKGSMAKYEDYIAKIEALKGTAWKDQKDLGNKAGISQGQISKLLNMKEKPNFASGLAVLEAIGAKIIFPDEWATIQLRLNLGDDVDPKKDLSSMSQFELSELFTQLVSAFSGGVYRARISGMNLDPDASTSMYVNLEISPQHKMSPQQENVKTDAKHGKSSGESDSESLPVSNVG